MLPPSTDSVEMLLFPLPAKLVAVHIYSPLSLNRTPVKTKFGLDTVLPW